MDENAREVAGRVMQACWVILVFYWVVAAASTKATARRMHVGWRLAYLFSVLVAMDLVMFSHRGPHPLDEVVIPRGESEGIVAMLLCVAGLVFAVWARVTLGRNWSGSVTLKVDHELVQSGPYALVRHPIYTGILAMVAATSAYNGTLGSIVGFVILTASFWVKLGHEEALMTKQFPREYPSYAARVRRLIPFLL
jgi:protein-S-isoprenylcysteine O-methyltransferase Ste14